MWASLNKLLRVSLDIRYDRVEGEDEAVLDFRMFAGLVHWRYVWGEPLRQSGQGLRERIIITERWWEWLFGFVQSIRIVRWRWRTELASRGGAAETALMCGAWYSLQITALGVLSHYMILRADHQVTVVPAWQTVHSQSKFKVEGDVRLEMGLFRFIYLWAALIYRIRGKRGLIRYLLHRKQQVRAS